MSTAPVYHCEICGRDFKHPGNYKQHMSSHMRTVTSAGPATMAVAAPLNPLLVKREPPQTASMASASNKANGKGNAFKCDICDEVLESHGNLKIYIFNFFTCCKIFRFYFSVAVQS